MDRAVSEYTVVSVRPANVTAQGGTAGEAPPEVLERFEGRTFTLGELEQRGVRIGGGRAYYTTNGRDWELEIFPGVGQAS